MHAWGPRAGSTLAARFASPVPMAPVEVAAVGAQLAGALEAWHRAGRRYGNMTPDAVGLTREPDGRLVARLLPGTADRPGRVLAPELCSGGPVGPAADLYDLGGLLLHALLGRGEDPPVIPDDLGAAWRLLLGAMLAESPADRPTAEHVVRTLGAVPGLTPLEHRRPAAAGGTGGDTGSGSDDVGVGVGETPVHPADGATPGPHSRLLPGGAHIEPVPVELPRPHRVRRLLARRLGRTDPGPDLRR